MIAITYCILILIKIKPKVLIQLDTSFVVRLKEFLIMHEAFPVKASAVFSIAGNERVGKKKTRSGFTLYAK